MGDLVDGLAGEFIGRVAEHLAQVPVAAQQTTVGRGVGDADCRVVEGTAVPRFAGPQRVLVCGTQAGGPLQTKEVPDRQGHRPQQHAHHQRQGACRGFTPALEHRRLVEFDHDHEGVGPRGAVGRQHLPAIVPALLVVVDLSLRETLGDPGGARVGARQARCAGRQQQRAVVAQHLGRGAGRVEGLAVMVDEVVAVDRGQQPDPTAVAQNELAQHRKEARGIGPGCRPRGAGLTVGEVAAGPGRADAKRRRRIGGRRLEAGQRHEAAEVARVGTGDDTAVGVEQGH